MSLLFKLLSKKITPKSVKGLQLWIDAADTSPTNIVQSAGAVSQWSDKSGNGNHGTQGTGSARPTTDATTQNGKNVLDFDGGDDLALPSGIFSIPNGANTLFTVAKRTTEDAGVDTIIGLTESGGTRWGMRFTGTAGVVQYTSSTANNGKTNSGNTNTDFQILTGFRTGTTVSISVNGGAAESDTQGADESGVDEAFVGSQSETNFLIGSIAEIIVYDRALATAEISAVNNYLSAKWAITLA